MTFQINMFFGLGLYYKVDSAYNVKFFSKNKK